MSDLKQIIAKNISSLRKEMHLTQAELAEKVNYTDKAVSKWERAESIPDIEILKKISDLFNVSLDYLVQEEHKTEKMDLHFARTKNNRNAITYLAAAGVWLVAAVLYFFMKIKDFEETWKLFAAAVPVTFIVLLVFNSIWGAKKIFFIILTCLVWTLLAFAYIMLLRHNLFFIFCIGVPMQIMIIIWSKIKVKKF